MVVDLKFTVRSMYTGGCISLSRLCKMAYFMVVGLMFTARFLRT